MIKFKILVFLILGVQCTPNLFAQYANKAIYFDTISGELPYSFFTKNEKLGVIGLMQDTTKNIYPIIYFDSLGYPTNLKKYKSKCPTVYPTSTNQLGKQNGHYYFLANCNPSFNKFEIYKILIDSLGDTVSTYRINNNDTSLARRTHFLPNGQMIMLGQNPSEYFVQKWDGDSLLWTYQSDVNSPIILHNILIDGDDIVVSGRIGIFNNNPGSDLYIAKLNKDGQLLWDLRKDFGESEVMGGLAKFNGEYVISFTKAPWINYPNHDLNTYVGFVNLNGTWITSKKIGIEGRSKIVKGSLLQSGNKLLFFVGEHNIEFNKRESIIYCLDKNFEVQWERHYLFEDDIKHSSNIWDARIEPDSTIKTIGVLYNGPGGQDLWYLHLDKHGCLTPGCEANDVNVEEVFFGDNNEVLIYPNPAQTTLNLQFSQNQSGQISLYNLQGVLVKKLSFNQTQNIIISVDDLPEGLYFIQVETSSGERFVKRFVVNSP